MKYNSLSYSSVLLSIRRMFAVLFLLVFTGIAGAQGVVDLFHLPNKEPFVRAIVTRDAAYPIELETDLSGMELRTRGIYTVVTGRDLAALLRTGVRVEQSIERPADAVVLYYLHLVTAQKTKRSIAILQTGHGKLIGEEAVGALAVMPMRAPINALRFTVISNGWPKFAGPFSIKYEDVGTGKTSQEDSGSGNALSTGSVFALPHPYFCGRPYMDERTVRNRGFVATRNQQVGTTRTLANETIRVRLPVDYDAKEPAGLLVWVNAGTNGSPPEVFAKALDQSYFICAGADNSGNERPVADRYQLALDTVASVSARYHIDPRRVYVTGISGGGRISSMLYAAASDVFTGTIAIVGLNFYKAIPTGDGRSWPATYRKPTGRLFALMRQHRIAAMTGPPDFNYKPIVATIRTMQSTHLDAKLFSYLEMGHELPTADRFADALAWVDEPYQKERAKETAVASRLLKRLRKQLESSQPVNPAQKKVLRRVMDTAPWSEPGWQAYDMVVGNDDGNGDSP